MTNLHINDVFNCFTPNEMQEKRILENITQAPPRTTKKHLRRKHMLVAYSLVMIIALLVGVFPTLWVNDDNRIEFAFTGLNLTAHAVSGRAIDMSSGVLIFDVEFFEKFDRVEVSVSKGALSINGQDNENFPTIILYGNATITWRYGDIANAVLSFEGFNEKGDIISAGSIDMSSGKILVIASYPIGTGNKIIVDEAGIDIEAIILNHLQNNASELADDANIDNEAIERSSEVIIDLNTEE